MAVPQQHAAVQYFEQSGAAVHPALCKPSLPLFAIVELAKANLECAWFGLVKRVCVANLLLFNAGFSQFSV